MGPSVLFRSLGGGRVREDRRVGEPRNGSQNPHPVAKCATRVGHPRGLSLRVLVRRRILFAAVWLDRLVCRAERGLLPTFLFFGSAISGGPWPLVARSRLLNLRLGTTGDLLFRRE